MLLVHPEGGCGLIFQEMLHYWTLTRAEGGGTQDDEEEAAAAAAGEQTAMFGGADRQEERWRGRSTRTTTAAATIDRGIRTRRPTRGAGQCASAIEQRGADGQTRGER